MIDLYKTPDQYLLEDLEELKNPNLELEELILILDYWHHRYYNNKNVQQCGIEIQRIFEEVPKQLWACYLVGTEIPEAASFWASLLKSKKHGLGPQATNRQ